MKGLIRNNFYSVGNSLPLLILCQISLLIASVVIFLINGFTNDFLNICIPVGIIGSQLGGFGALCGTFIQKDALSKWSKFEPTLPVSRATIINARFLSFLLYFLMGVMMSIISILIFYVIGVPLYMERISFALTFGLTFGLGIPTLMSPLTITFGADKNEVLLFFSITAGIVCFFGGSTLWNISFPESPHFRICYLIGAIVLFICSYLFTQFLYKKKELV